MNKTSALGSTLIASFAVAVAACGSGSVVIHKPESAQVNHEVTLMWARDVRRVARTGGWILSRSYSLTGDVIVALTRGVSASHSSIYDARTDTVIEALTPKVREVPLESLLERNRLVIVVRPSGLDNRERMESVERARTMVGTNFDVGGLVGVGSDERFYCSELVFWASGLEKQQRPRVISPAKLTDYGEVVYYSGKRDDAHVQSTAHAQRLLLRQRALLASERY